MTKPELISEIAAQTGFTKKVSEQFLNTFTSVVEATLIAGEDVSIVNFGKFTVVNRAERNGVNPLTQEKLVIAARKAPVFRVAPALKKAVSEV
jgi:DNA-binding protein HU-beta